MCCIGWLADWLVDWCVGVLVGWLIGWLIGVLYWLVDGIVLTPFWYKLVKLCDKTIAATKPVLTTWYSITRISETR